MMFVERKIKNKYDNVINLLVFIVFCQKRTLFPLWPFVLLVRIMPHFTIVYVKFKLVGLLL